MKTLVAGMGVSGLETVRFLQRTGGVFETWDERKTVDQICAEPDISNLTHHQEIPDMSGFERVVTSPGLGLDHPLLVAARNAGVPIWSEIELAWRHQCGKVIALTGSNGKSTTVSLIHHILAENGFNSHLCGNIGTPFIACANNDPKRIYVLEVSSFQLEHVHAFRPDIGILLNVAPDHLDRHGDLETYRQTKLRLFAQQKAGDLAICDPEHYDMIPGSASPICVPGEKARIADGQFRLNQQFALDQTCLPLLGAHNRLNALFACVVAKEMGLTPSQVGHAMTSFPGLEHRMEKVGEYQGRLWINDSKATNVHAANAAFQSMEQPYVLVLGGSGKGGGFTDLDFGKNLPRAIVAYGQTSQRICTDIAHLNPLQVNDFRQACLKAHQLAQPGDAVLMSPACASFDQHNNYMHRGQMFKELFHAQEAGQ